MEKEIKTQNQGESNVREVEVNIAPLLSTLLKKLWLIVLCTLVMALLFQGFTRVFIKPTYKSSFTAFVNNQTKIQAQKSEVNTSDLQASRELVQTYARILTSNTVLEAAANSKILNFNVTPQEISGYISTEIEDKTQIIKVNVITTDAQKSYKIAQAIATEAPAKMAIIVKGSSMSTVDEPQLPLQIHGPNYLTVSLIGALFGFALALAYVIIRYFRDDTIKGEGDLEGRYNLPVVGVIPNMTENKGFDYYQNYYYTSSKDEQSNSGKEKK